MSFRPQRRPGLAFGLGGLLVLAAGDAALLLYLRAAAPSLLTFLAWVAILISLPVAVWLGYGCYGLACARYVLSPNALVVDWGWRREVLPLAHIEAAHLGSEIQAGLHFQGPRWPGYVVGSVATASGVVEFLATSVEQNNLVLINTPDHWLALSPADPAAFVQAFHTARAQGATEVIEPESVRRGPTDWAMWRDRPALVVIGVSGLSLLALFGYLSLLYSRLPPEIALHFDAHGQPNRFGPPAGLFILPAIAGLTWLINTALGVWWHQRRAERAGAYLLFGSTTLVQALVWIATIGLLTAGR